MDPVFLPASPLGAADGDIATTPSQRPTNPFEYHFPPLDAAVTDWKAPLQLTAATPAATKPAAVAAPTGAAAPTAATTTSSAGGKPASAAAATAATAAVDAKSTASTTAGSADAKSSGKPPASVSGLDPKASLAAASAIEALQFLDNRALLKHIPAMVPLGVRQRTLKEDQEESILMEPYEYINSMKGKNVRNMLIDAFNNWLSVSGDALHSIKAITERLHNASLMIDDIEDRSTLRRSHPCTHLIFGDALTINTANYVYFQAMSMARTLHPQALELFVDEMLNLHRGQGLDIYWREKSECPTLNDYRKMVCNKTGGLFRLSVKLLQLFSSSKADYLNLANNLGLFFQIRDDFANLQLDEYSKNKSFAEDISEGKFSFPAIHCILSAWPDRKLVLLLKQKTADPNLKLYAIDLMKKTGSFDYCIRVMRDLRDLMVAEVKSLGGNPALSAIIAALCKDIL